MLRIKLARTGKKNAPSFRIVVGPGTKINEVLGVFNPQSDPPLFKVDKERVKYWMGQGAKSTQAVEKILEGKYEFKPYVPRKAGEDSQEEPQPKSGDGKKESNQHEEAS